MTESDAAEKICRFCTLVRTNQMPAESLLRWARDLANELKATTATAVQLLDLASEVASGSRTLDRASSEAEGLQILAAVDPGLRMVRTTEDCETFLQATGYLHDAQLVRLEYLGTRDALSISDLVDLPAWPVCILRFDQVTPRAGAVARTLEVLAFSVARVHVRPYEWIKEAELSTCRLAWDKESNVEASWIAWRWASEKPSE
ncbi:MAG: hypothetical protein AMXMBFR33_30310 [Candidatus Xenobia bacterium]